MEYILLFFNLSMNSLRMLSLYFYTLFFALSPLVFAKPSLEFLGENSKAVEYFAEFYSYDGNLGLPAGSHSFGRFVKTINGKPVEKIDISWLPKEEYMGPFKRMPLFTAVPGKNRTLEETFLIAGNKAITNHGKFSITETLFNGAKQRKILLDSGKVPYKLLATANSDEGLNCIHALMGSLKDFPTGMKSGVQATDAIIHRFLDQKAMTPVATKDLKTESLPRNSWSRNQTESISPIEGTARDKSHSVIPKVRSLLMRTR